MLYDENEAFVNLQDKTDCISLLLQAIKFVGQLAEEDRPEYLNLLQTLWLFTRDDETLGRLAVPTPRRVPTAQISLDWHMSTHQ